MIRGTTPTHSFKCPFDLSTISKLRIIYRQGDTNILIKTLEDCTLNGNEISCKLSQEETLKFDCRKMVKIQLRVVTLSGDALVSSTYELNPYDCFDDEVM